MPNDDKLPPSVAVPESPAVTSRPQGPAGAPTTDDRHSSSPAGQPWDKEGEVPGPTSD
jgi:hypothetical protein